MLSNYKITRTYINTDTFDRIMIKKHLASLILFAFLVPAFSFAQVISAAELMNKMQTAITNVKTVKYRFWKQERMHSKMEISEQEVKLQVKPFKAYMYNYLPNLGSEAIFIPGQNNNNALVSPNSFPWKNLNLDPFGAMSLS